VNDRWGQPANLGPGANSSSDEILPNFSPDGHLMFFSTNRLKASGDFDIWVSRRANPHDDFGWEPPVNLGPGINTTAFEAAPHYFEETLIFSSNRPGGVGVGTSDLYMITRTKLEGPTTEVNGKGHHEGNCKSFGR
jgi:hypothetical protein